MSDDIVERLREDELRLGQAAFDSAGAGLSCNLASEAADEIERLRAELAAANARMSDLDFERTATRLMLHTVEAERDALRAELDAEQGIKCETLRMLEHVAMERDALRAQLAEAREALEPFAEIADTYEIDALSVGDLETFIDVVDLRRARAVLEKNKGCGDE